MVSICSLPRTLPGLLFKLGNALIALLLNLGGVGGTNSQENATPPVRRWTADPPTAVIERGADEHESAAGAHSDTRRRGVYATGRSRCHCCV